MTTNWPDAAAVFAICEPRIKEFEGFRAAPYLDSANVPTIGYGTIQYPAGPCVTMADYPITEPYAAECLEFQMTQKVGLIAVLMIRMPTAHQAAAMLSLTYNIGTHAFIGATVLRKFNAGDVQAAADAFLVWDKAIVDGTLVVVPGLLVRRQQERTLFLTPD